MATVQQIGILGGGFGGLYTALKLAKYPWPKDNRPQITLVDQNERFVFLPFLYELITGEMHLWEVAPTYQQILAHSPVQFIQGTVTTIDPRLKQVRVSGGQVLSCDRLVLALGGETPLSTVPGAAEHALTFHSLADAEALKSRLQDLDHHPPAPVQVAVVGAGPSGVELSCKLADRLGHRGQVTLIDRNDSLLKSAAAANRKAAEKALAQRHVIQRLNTRVVQVKAQAITLEQGGISEDLATQLVLWTVGNTIPGVVAALAVPKTEGGQILTTATLQVQGHHDVFALGDLATGVDAQGQAIPSTAQAAFQAADYAAYNIWASLTGRSLLPFHYSHLGEMLTLGVDEAALAGLGVTLEGPLASVARRLVYLMRFPTLEHQINVGLEWMLKPFQQTYSQS
ncbi:NAD(P)/FAD-dependent oxidoreductase [Lyngbya confervoides]|uniref:FAD-dependent oxidoreductase n=1 Tax=Lyngbya confervoides BDU141951 TaxID=1574623 RepID=A0ABD4T0C7_9CYAN|nr:FAD-dependent oxidoreductase [Lyngbya confervoides]MCM1982019.1 FAD-dependent oxidoreductase [Lyngbya confervoides BDU141951]